MSQVVGSSLRRRYRGHGLFQLGMLGTTFAALRVLQSPSTLTFFVLETAAAATAGIFLSDRANDLDRGVRAAIPETGFSEVDGVDIPPLRRLQRVAARLGVDSTGLLEQVQNAIKIAVAPSSISSKGTWSEDGQGRAAIDQILAGSERREYSRVPSALRAHLSRLAEEGRRLVQLTQEIGLSSAAYERTLRKASDASKADRLDSAIALLENGNRRLRARLSQQVGEDLKVSRNSLRKFLVLSSVFFVLIAMAMLTLSTALYVAPTSFFVLIALASGVIGVNAQIEGNRRPSGILAQIVVLGSLLKFYFFFLNPYLYSSDTFYHFLGVLGLANTGHVPASLGHYTFFPAYHVYAFAGVSVTGLPLMWYGVFGFVAQLAAVPVAYLIGREIASPRVGLFAALLTVLSVFFFLWAIPLPSLFGIVFLLLALYALVAMQKSVSWGWFAVFWLSALAALFSHPITALVLLLALLLRFAYLFAVSRGTSRTRGFAIPSLSYAVAYAGYLAFIAIISLETFARALFAPAVESAPLATRPQAVLQTSAAFLVQSALAPVNIAILFFFAAYGMMASRGISWRERRFLVLLGGAFIVIPALEVVLESFRGQSSRFLGYMVVPLALIGAHGVVRANASIQGKRRVAGAIFVVFVVLAFTGASSYLTTNDERVIFSEIPAIPTHITQSALTSREFIGLAKQDSVVYMDFGSWIYFYADRQRARFALHGVETDTLDQLSQRTGQAFVVVNDDFIPYGNPYLGTVYDGAAIQMLLESSQASLVFSTGKVRVYLVQ